MNVQKLPKTGSDLWEAFKNARVPSPTELQGAYAVDMLTALPSLKRFGHRKVFVPAPGMATGMNVLLKNLRWGRFFLEEAVMADQERLRVLVINYNTRGNSFLTRGIRDYVRAVEGTRLYLGRFNMIINGKPRFLGYFSLTKID